MDWAQLLYVTLLIVALAAGRPHWLIVAAMVVDLAATVIFRGDNIAVGTADLLCAVALLFAGWRGRVVSLLFAMMQPVYVLALAYGWKYSTTYAIVDAIAYLQLGVIGGLDAGISSARRWASDRRNNSRPRSSQTGGHATVGVARILPKGRGQ